MKKPQFVSPRAPTDEEQAEYDYRHDFDWSDAIWYEALRWAKKGQPRPLSDALRGDTPIDGNGGRDVREFLADYLAGKIKRRKGARPRIPQGVWATDFDGTPVYIRKSGAVWYEAAAWVRRYKQEHHSKFDVHENAVKEAAKTFKLGEGGLRRWLGQDNSKKERAKRFGWPRGVNS